MLQFTKNETQVVYFTASENCTLINPYFLFVFTNRVTSEEVKFVVENESSTLRYDMFTLNVDTYFENSETGFWKYDVYEQESNEDLSIIGKHKVETGLMYLNPSEAFSPDKYDEQSNEFQTYNG